MDKDRVIIRTPYNKSTSEIQRIIQVKKGWIFKKQLEFNKKSDRKPAKKSYAQSIFKRRINHFASKLGVFPRKTVVKDLKSRWGSATKDNVINLNVNLLKAPKDVIDYVILHELCHLKIRNHSHHFWNLVRKFMPNYTEKRHWLEVNSSRIVE